MDSTTFAIEEQASKVCTKCGVEQSLSFFYTTGKKVSGAPKYNSWCKSCISEKQSSYHKRTWGKEKLNYSAFQRTKSARSYLQYLRSKAVQRKKSSDVISLDALEKLWEAQEGKCAITGWQMTMELANGVVPTNCSIDRIDSAKGYEQDNIQLVCRAVNVAKSDLSTKNFVALCDAVLRKLNA